MSKKKHKQYTIMLKVVVETDMQVSADSYEDALVKARELDVRDVVEFDTPYNDGDISVIGVYRSEEEPK